MLLQKILIKKQILLTQNLNSKRINKTTSKKDQEMDPIKAITIKTFQIKKKTTLIKITGENTKNQILNLMELLNLKVFWR